MKKYLTTFLLSLTLLSLTSTIGCSKKSEPKDLISLEVMQYIHANKLYQWIEKNLNTDGFKLNKFIINKKLKNSLEGKTKDLTNLINVDEINNVKNWIEFKRLFNKVFAEIN